MNKMICIVSSGMNIKKFIRLVIPEVKALKFTAH